MAVFYKLYQNNNKNFVNKGKWYARSVITETVDTNQLAARIQRNCTVKKSDVLAVLTELTEVMQDELQASHRVKLNGIGSFKIGISTGPADTAKDFQPAKHLKGLHVLFSPEMKKDASQMRTRALLNGCLVMEAPKNGEPAGETEVTTGGTTGNNESQPLP